MDCGAGDNRFPAARLGEDQNAGVFENVGQASGSRSRNMPRKRKSISRANPAGIFQCGESPLHVAVERQFT